MVDWIKKLNDILIINENEILEHSGNISHQLAIEIAEAEFEKYHTARIAAADIKALHDLDEELKQLQDKKPENK